MNATFFYSSYHSISFLWMEECSVVVFGIDFQ